MTRYTLHVPEHLNDGSPVHRRALWDIESRLVDIGGGFTLTRAEGAWRGDDGTIYREPMRLYAVDSEDDLSGLLHLLAQSVAIRLAQEAVYLTSHEVVTSLVTQIPVA